MRKPIFPVYYHLIPEGKFLWLVGGGASNGKALNMKTLNPNLNPSNDPYGAVRFVFEPNSCQKVLNPREDGISVYLEGYTAAVTPLK